MTIFGAAVGAAGGADGTFESFSPAATEARGVPAEAELSGPTGFATGGAGRGGIGMAIGIDVPDVLCKGGGTAIGGRGPGGGGGAISPANGISIGSCSSPLD